MEKKFFLKSSILVATAIFTIGCAGQKTVEPNKKNPSEKKTSEKTESKKPSGVKLSELNSGGVTKLSLKGNQDYKEKELIEFTIDTKENEGYLYIIYLDSNGETGVLYPNPKSPPSEISGTYTFPKDFGDMDIRATKDCKDCEKDKTVIYALLSKEPIIDIHTINKSQLASIVGQDLDETSNVKHKGISMNLDAGNTNNNSNISVGRLEFFIK
jgi:hypothetical protein